MELLFDLLEELPFQSVPGSEVMPNTTVSRQPLASTSSFASEDSYLSDSSINAGAGTGNILLDQFADINLLLAQQNQVCLHPHKFPHYPNIVQHGYFPSIVFIY